MGHAGNIHFPSQSSSFSSSILGRGSEETKSGKEASKRTKGRRKKNRRREQSPPIPSKQLN